ncbi:sugar phosphate isomerase/epimerase family protein [Photobacterium leiognathi]|uniref:sugar phosphate isomerase/epimerase family protein n=1 Tax=Photobacterium leiognathi TaxID=553611 RepID=UPI0029810486|nr:sugar phosphate isomerase/epimerase [Photobacterium leiognathi]
MISVSNIAWDIDYDSEIQELFIKSDVKYVDIAPTKYFPNIYEVKDEDIVKLREKWESVGVKPYGMQSLLFGTVNFNIFSDKEKQDEILNYLSIICRIGDKLGARKLVFGSPRNRDRGLFDDREVEDTAIYFFRQLGDIAKSYNVEICLEPNPKCYNSNFMVDSLETLKIVKLVNHHQIKMQLDIGAMCINSEDPCDVISKIHNHVGHIHISEPNLIPLSNDNEYHKEIAPLIKKYFSEHVLAIEILANSDLVEIEKSIQIIKEIYKETLK